MRRARERPPRRSRAAAEQRGLVDAVEQVGGALVIEEEKLRRCKDALEAHEREERDISHKLEHVRTLLRAQESNLRDAEAMRKRAESDFEGETREWAVRVDAQKREHEAAVVRLEQLHREAAGLEREAAERRAEYEAERSEFRKELERERSSTEATLAEKEREQRRKAADFEDACRRRVADFETECGYAREELRDERNKLEDSKAELGRREEAVEDAMRRAEKDIEEARAVLRERRKREAELDRRAAAVKAAEDAQEAWKKKTFEEAAKSCEDREKALKQWEARVRAEREDARVRDAAEKESARAKATIEEFTRSPARLRSPGGRPSRP